MNTNVHFERFSSMYLLVYKFACFTNWGAKSDGVN